MGRSGLFRAPPRPLWTAASAALGYRPAARKRRAPRVYWPGVLLDRHLSDEADLPAQKAKARPQARISCTHADAPGTSHAEAPAGEGSQAADGVMQPPLGPRARSRRARLSRSADFDRVFRQGRSHAGRELVLHVFPRGSDAGPPRLGLSVSRKVGGAVQRNRVKRLLREAFAAECARLPPGTDAVVVARQDAWALTEREGLAGVRRRLADLIKRAEGQGA